MDYFISDMHLQHDRIIDLNHRPFSNVDEMTKVIIKNWNSVVSKDDTVYILGDYYNGKSVGQFVDITTKLNGHKHLIIGNHDEIVNEIDKDILNSLFESISEQKEIVVNNKLIILNHYPYEDGYWKGYPNSIHLHGHKHFKQNKMNCLKFDVGVDANDFFPVSAEYILKICKTNCLRNRHQSF